MESFPSGDWGGSPITPNTRTGKGSVWDSGLPSVKTGVEHVHSKPTPSPRSPLRRGGHFPSGTELRTRLVGIEKDPGLGWTVTILQVDLGPQLLSGDSRPGSPDPSGIPVDWVSRGVVGESLPPRDFGGTDPNKPGTDV